MRRPFLTAEWLHLAMLNYDVPADVLAPLVPRGVELDEFEGRTMVSMVGFLFDRTKVRGLAMPFHRTFEEVNLRFYVRRGDRRGVVFIKEIVPRFLIAWTARALYNENYVSLPMRHEIAPGKAASYSWRFNRRWCSLGVECSGDPALPAPDSEAAFITEHYWGYTNQRDGSTIEYQVTHPQWRVWQARAARFDCDVAGLYGGAFAPCMEKEPTSAFLAEGSSISVYAGVTVAA